MAQSVSHHKAEKVPKRYLTPIGLPSLKLLGLSWVIAMRGEASFHLVGVGKLWSPGQTQPAALL